MTFNGQSPEMASSRGASKDRPGIKAACFRHPDCRLITLDRLYIYKQAAGWHDHRRQLRKICTKHSVHQIDGALIKLDRGPIRENACRDCHSIIDKNPVNVVA